MPSVLGLVSHIIYQDLVVSRRQSLVIRFNLPSAFPARFRPHTYPEMLFG